MAKTLLFCADALFALARDHENGVSQQSLTRFECADSPFGLMPYGIANANLRILPSGCCATPTRNAPSGYTKLHERFARDSSYSLPISEFTLDRKWKGNEQPTFRVFSCSVTTLFVSVRSKAWRSRVA